MPLLQLRPSRLVQLHWSRPADARKSQKKIWMYPAIHVIPSYNPDSFPTLVWFPPTCHIIIIINLIRYTVFFSDHFPTIGFHWDLIYIYIYSLVIKPGNATSLIHEDVHMFWQEHHRSKSGNSQTTKFDYRMVWTNIPFYTYIYIYNILLFHYVPSLFKPHEILIKP